MSRDDNILPLEFHEPFKPHMHNDLLRLLAPRYWPYWLLLGILRLLVMLPYKTQLHFGKWLGRLLVHVPSKSRATASINLKLCFPKLSEEERQQHLQKNFEAVGMAFFETALGWWGTTKRLRAIPFEIIGLEHLQFALQKGKGVMLCSPHLTSLELVGRLLTLQIPIAVMVRPQKKALLEYIIRQARNKHYQQVVARSDIRGMLRALKNNIAVWYAADIDAGIKNSVFAPFFGILAATITATSRYAKISAAAVIPTFFYRRTDDKGYEIIFKPALDNFPSEQLEKDALDINQIFEDEIRQHPDQYLWQYKRFKTRPQGESRFY